MPTPLPNPPADSDAGLVASVLLAVGDAVARELHAGNRGLSPAQAAGADTWTIALALRDGAPPA